MAIKKLNPFHRTIRNTFVRQSEFIAEYTREGRPARIVGEMTNITITPQYQNVSVTVAGAGVLERSTLTHYRLEFTYLLGTDGGSWEQIEEDMHNGIYNEIAMTITTRDEQTTRLNGQRMVRYNGWEMLEHTGYENSSSDSTSPRTGSVVMTAPPGAKVLLEQFRTVQGVSQ